MPLTRAKARFRDVVTARHHTRTGRPTIDAEQHFINLVADLVTALIAFGTIGGALLLLLQKAVEDKLTVFDAAKAVLVAALAGGFVYLMVWSFGSALFGPGN